MDTPIRQILSNIFSSYFGKGVGILLGIILIPFLIVKLGAAVFGVTVLAESIIAVIDVAAGSARASLSRHMTIALARGDMKEFSEYLSTGRHILMLLAGIVLCVALLVTWLVPYVFKVPAGLIFQTQILFFLMSLAFMATVPNIVFWSILYAKQRFDLINFSISGGLILRAVLIFAAFSFLPARYVSLPTYGVIYLLVSLMQNYLIYYGHKKVFPEARQCINRRFVSRERIREIFSLSVFTSFYNLNSVFYDGSIQILINRFFGPVANAIFAVSLKFSLAMKKVFQQTTWTLTPTFTDFAGRNDQSRLEQLLFGSMRLTIFFSVPVCIFLIVFAREIILKWVGPQFLIAATIMPVHLTALIFTMPLYANGCIFMAYARLGLPCLLSLAGTVILIASSLVMIQVFHIGILALAVADALVTVLYLVFFSSYYVRRVAGIPMREYLFDSYLKPILLTAVLWWPVARLIRHELYHESLAAAAAVLVLAIAAYLWIGYAVLMKHHEREYVSKNFSRLKSRLGTSTAG